MKDILKELEALLDQHDYRVVMQTTPGGCLTSFPGRSEEPMIGPSRLYQEFTHDGVLVCIHDENGIQVSKEEIECPVYAQALFTMYHVICRCADIGYHASLVKLVVNGKEQVEEDVFWETHKSQFMSPSNAQQEGSLRKLLESCFLEGFQPVHSIIAQNEGVEEGYNTIRRLWISDAVLEQMPEYLNPNLINAFDKDVS